MKNSRNRLFGARWVLPLVLALVCGACNSLVPHDRHQSVDPDQRLRDALAKLERARSVNENRNAILKDQDVLVDPQSIRREIETLAVEYPSHTPTLVANGVLAYQAGRLDKASDYLDRVLSLYPEYSPAAALRGQLALEQGNVQFAKALLEQHVRQTPDSSELREVYAAALYFADDLVGAERQTKAAVRLGSPEWRVQYHMGLIAEGLGKTAEARRIYQKLVDEYPTFELPRSRLAGL